MPAGTAREADQAAPVDVATLLNTVRAFYLDIAQWHGSPHGGGYGRSAARSAPATPDPQGTQGRKSRMDQRTRERLPAIPALATAVLDQARADAANLLAAARDAAPARSSPPPGRPCAAPTDHPDPAGLGRRRRRVRRDLIREEDQAFWAWAAVEVLRHTGVRVEQLLHRTLPSQPGPVPAASHRRAHPAAARRTVQDR